MKRYYLLIVLLCTYGFTQAQSWKMVAGKIASPWASDVNPLNPLPEYPRPQLVRDGWTNLNGLWDYAIRPQSSTVPTAFDGKILVPFAVESALSGVGTTVGKDQILWYKRSITLPANTKGKNVLLHFGAVDWQCDVFVNGVKAGTHEGGYDPFYFDITPHLKKGAQEIVIRVWDPSDEGPQPRGKQVTKPARIWYTPVTGIWQTVWLESVSPTYIKATRNTTDIATGKVTIKALVENIQAGDVVHVSAWTGTVKVVEAESAAGTDAVMTLPTVHRWSPNDPFLYDLKVTLLRKGKTVDDIKGYFAMRKISMSPDKNGVQRMLLNDEFVFQYGPLDQGWWPDGLYTAPTDEALKFDIEKTKAMGFNMIRKHVKVEPARWYTYCDKLGMLVWQDMPSGDLGNRWDDRPGVLGLATDKVRTPESESIFRKEWKAIIDATSNFPSIVVWVPFNEAWGQFKTKEIVEWTMQYDPTRLVNTASGGNFEHVGHIMDLHHYPEPAMPDPQLFGKDRVIVLGEFGGLGLPIEGHTWLEKNNWGYQTFETRDALLQRYSAFISRMEPLIRKGLSAAVYTQTTDVEIEVNGLMTYDRKEIKFPVDELRKLHNALYSLKPE